MSLEQLRAFLAKAKGNSNLQEKLKAAQSPHEVINIAKEHGHEFTADKISLLSEKELEHVAGGVAGCINCHDSNQWVASRGELMP
ncbi:nif11-like leader peptide domain protein [Synechococcus sp. BIOS-E4-1]|uniref:Nif11-like leader peptide family natural product precursor n=1 Tax=Synechococcus sp. BIOS-E4-1 TaxID=1400864 RepID=UPI0016488493|nr:Nif11-like leader peptide family natural product precursor [Synechococcus sp. BIOS-E4-1]QNI53568.1 nif11-like leader peptide domain protein [Synechococcus sp. BIOS-E4-1]